MGRLALLLVLAVVTACGAAGTTSRADSCRTGVILGNITAKKSSAELAVENMRCDNIEASERENERAERQLKLATDQAKAQDRAAAAQERRLEAVEAARQNEELAKIRRNPLIPEVGGTPDEAKLLCKRQHGQYHEPEDNIGCLVGGQRVFACHVVNEILQRCDGYIEDADIIDFRTEFEKKLGPATQEVHGGVRVFEWTKGRIVISLRMYDRGVRTGSEIR